jgi:hypothetical protein
MRLFEIAQLKESMTMWVPDAPSELKDLTCDFCGGDGNDSYYNPKTGHRYYEGDETIEQRLTGWDERLKTLAEKNKRVDSKWYTIKSFHDANIENHPELKSKFDEQFGEMRAEYEKVKSSIALRTSRIKKKSELIQQLEKIDCGFCKGKGTYEEQVSDAPEMNLSNINAQNLMSALGYEPNSGYNIKPEDVPTIKRRIVQLTNTDDLDDFTMKGGASQKDFGMVRSKDPETGLDKIERKKGPTMIGPEIDIDYLTDKFERMIPILDYAQEHNQEIHFA